MEFTQQRNWLGRLKHGGLYLPKGYSEEPGAVGRFIRNKILPLGLITAMAVPGEASADGKVYYEGEDYSRAVMVKYGEANGDAQIDIADAIYTLGFLFARGQQPICKKAADANNDGSIDIGDVICTLSRLFAHGAAPEGWPALTPDTKADSLDCLFSYDRQEPQQGIINKFRIKVVDAMSLEPIPNAYVTRWNLVFDEEVYRANAQGIVEFEFPHNPNLKLHLKVDDDDVSGSIGTHFRYVGDFNGTLSAEFVVPLIPNVTLQNSPLPNLLSLLRSFDIKPAYGILKAEARPTLLLENMLVVTSADANGFAQTFGRRNIDYDTDLADNLETVWVNMDEYEGRQFSAAERERIDTGIALLNFYSFGNKIGIVYTSRRPVLSPGTYEGIEIDPGSINIGSSIPYDGWSWGGGLMLQAGGDFFTELHVTTKLNAIRDGKLQLQTAPWSNYGSETNPICHDDILIMKSIYGRKLFGLKPLRLEALTDRMTNE